MKVYDDEDDDARKKKAVRHRISPRTIDCEGRAAAVTPGAAGTRWKEDGRFTTQHGRHDYD